VEWNVFALLGFGMLFLLLDRWSKRMAQSGILAIHSSIGELVQIRYVTNRNPLYTRVPVRFVLVGMWVFAACSVIALYSTGTWFRSLSAMAGLGCALGGAAGNLLDIIRRRCVIDFIDLGWWPTFNLADLGIIGGLVLAFWR
jgi:signal peptidase II